MSKKARELEGMAEECRRIAIHATYDTVREQLLEIADQFDRMAADRRRELERRGALTSA